MAEVRAVIFDMDGTFLDSRELIYQAIEHVFSGHGIHMDRVTIGKEIGKPIKAIYGALMPHWDTDDLEVAEVEHLAHHDDHMGLLKLYDGVVETLETIRSKGIKTGVFTGFNKITHDRLASFGLTNLFDTVVETSRYTAHKPDPEGLFVAMQDLAITDASQVVYVGDAISDILAGKSAHVKATIGCTHGFCSRELLEEAGADYVVDSFVEILNVLEKLERDSNGS
jgi:pyrophosphatase PpaX